MPSVSVVIPVYYVEQYIVRCLNSIIEQTLKDIEIIVVDDCSPDNSMCYVRDMAEKDNRIKIFSHSSNKGLMWARKTGYSQAKGDYITFCDSDDYLPQNALDILYKEALKTGADVLSGNLEYIDLNGNHKVLFSTLKYGNDKESAFKSLLRGELRHNLCSKLFKRTLLTEYNYITYENFTNGEDGCLFYQIVNNCDSIVQIDNSVYYYMQNTASSSQVRLGENAIKSICIANKMRLDVVSKYPRLRKDLKKCITKVLSFLYAEGYDKDARLKHYINEYKLQEYLTLYSFVKYNTFMNIIYLIFRRTKYCLF